MVMGTHRVSDSSMIQESGTRQEGPARPLLKGIGEPFSAYSVAYELRREREQVMKSFGKTWGGNRILQYDLGVSGVAMRAQVSTP
jgi:hypothetical protein